MVSRRTFLRSAALISIGAAAGFSSYSYYRRSVPKLLSAATDKQGVHYGVMLDEYGNIIEQEQFPNRCHASLFNPFYDTAVYFSRRPGNALFISPRASKRAYVVRAEAGYHFYGHGTLALDGRYLFASENEYETGRGIISIRDFQDGLRTIKKIPSYGLGPHELALMHDGKTLVVANGGLRTHPEKTRIPMNLASMAPNISFIDSHSGELIRQYKPSNRQMSLRHLSVAGDGNVFVGGQYQGAVLDRTHLVATVSKTEGITNLVSPNHFGQNHQQYTASVCCISDELTLVSCPKVNKITAWQQSGFAFESTIRDVAGITAIGDKVYFSAGDGSLGGIDIHNKCLSIKKLKHYSSLRWDNHLIGIVSL